MLILFIALLYLGETVNTLWTVVANYNFSEAYCIDCMNYEILHRVRKKGATLFLPVT